MTSQAKESLLRAISTDTCHACMQDSFGPTVIADLLVKQSNKHLLTGCSVKRSHHLPLTT